MVKAINHMNGMQYDKIKDPDIKTRMLQYDLGHRMQDTMPEVANINEEPKHIREMYGNNSEGKTFLLARRLVERGVRFVQVYAGEWDTHSALKSSLPGKVKGVDQPLTALIKDLKQVVCWMKLWSSLVVNSVVHP